MPRDSCSLFFIIVYMYMYNVYDFVYYKSVLSFFFLGPGEKILYGS